MLCYRYMVGRVLVFCAKLLQYCNVYTAHVLKLAVYGTVFRSWRWRKQKLRSTGNK